LDLNYLTAYNLKKKMESGQISCLDIAESVFSRIEDIDGTVNAYIRVEKENALKEAKKVDKRLSSGEKIEDFTGIPVGIKDNICTEGITTTCASKILEEYVPIYDATVIRKLKKRGYILTGKLNMDEFAMGSSNENSYFGPVSNPWDISRVPGGSSGGPAASVAAGEAICSLGSDTGGSIRQPASLCGVVGFKPTYGLVSRYGLVAFASSLDQIGTFTRDMRDCASLLNVICGHDSFDSTSIDSKVTDYRDFLRDDIKGMKIGVPVELMPEGTETDVKEKIMRALKMAEDMGAFVEEVSIPSLEYALNIYYIIAPSEASSNLSRFDGVRYGYRDRDAATLREMYRKTRSRGFGEEVKRRIMIGTYCLSAGYYDSYYEKALKVRTLIIDDFKKAFSKYDVLISPTSPTTAFKKGEKLDDPLTMYLSDICTIPANLAGIPAVSIPAGLSGNGLPIGLQVMGDVLREDNVIRAAFSLEKAVGFNQIPDI
jgi:aspartyl-tRNA(Asn)/glutamyl-tRNA(Gln) amidotransferase subunit A